ncbi:MAG: M20/M25/M40 family metallo-hydrolase, partial [Planctomycetes bacterium]|nr:M20/M25/M40 family metallo-hydrolase [Planctomycetota bacterium]
KNVIPSACRLTIDRRLAPGEDFDTFAGELEEFTAGVDCSVEQRRGSLPVLADLEGPLVKLGEDILGRRFGQVDYYYNRGRVDLSYFGKKTREILNMGPGVINKPHKANEYASIPALVTAYDVLKELLESLEA